MTINKPHEIAKKHINKPLDYWYIRGKEEGRASMLQDEITWLEDFGLFNIGLNASKSLKIRLKELKAMLTEKK